MTDSITLINTDTGSTIKIDANNGDYWLDSVDWGTVSSEQHTYKYVDQIGVNLYNTTLNTRQITITGWIAGSDEARVKRLKQKLNSFVNPKQTIEVLRGEYRLLFNPLNSVKYATRYEDNNDRIVKFLISGFCPYPLFNDRYDSVVLLASTEPKLRFPLVIPSNTGIIFGARQPSLIADLYNAGDFPIGYTIEFKALGSVSNPSIVDIQTQEFVKIKKTLASGEIVRVYTQEGGRRIVGVMDGVESNYFRYRDYESSWLQLKQGHNLLRYNAESGLSLLEVSITFNPCYMEVEE